MEYLKIKNILTILTFLLLVFINQINGEQFLYRNLVLGMYSSTDKISVRNISQIEKGLLRLVESTILEGNKQLYANESFNSTRISNINVTFLNFDDDLTQYSEISVLMSITNCEETHDLNKRVTETFGSIIHIGITNPGCPRLDAETSITIPITWFQDMADLHQLIVDLRQTNALPEWRHSVTIYDKQSGKGVLDTVIRGFSHQDDLPDVAISLFGIDSLSAVKTFDSQLEVILQKYSRSDGNFIVITQASIVDSFLSIVKRNSMLKIGNKWLFISNDRTKKQYEWNYITKRVIDEGVNIAFLTFSGIHEENKNQLFCVVEFILTMLSDVVEHFAAKEEVDFAQVSDEEWELVKDTRPERVLNIIKRIKDQLNEKVLKCTQNPKSWVFNTAENGKFGKKVWEIGFWNTYLVYRYKKHSTILGINLDDDIFPHVTGGFRGREINVASFHFPPWQIFKTDPITGKTIYTGLIFEIFNMMADKLNFTYNVILPRGGSLWGKLGAQGSWDGVIGMVVDNEVLIAAAAFTVTPERAGVVNYTLAFERETYTFMVRRRSELMRFLMFADPYHFEVWCGIAISVVVTSFALYFIHGWSEFYPYHGKVTGRGLFQMKNCFWFMFGSLVQQGGVYRPEANSGRLLMVIWWLFVIALSTSYCGSLVAFLTYPKVEGSVNSIDDIIRRRGVRTWGFRSGSDIEGHLLRSNNSKFQDLYEGGERHERFNDTVVDLIRDSSHAYIDWKITLMMKVSEEQSKTKECEYVLGAEEIFEEQIAMIVPRTSPYLSLFNNEIKSMLENGMIKRIQRQFWPSKDKCSMIAGSGAGLVKRVQNVRLQDMQGSFYILSGGFIFAVTILLIECCVERQRKLKVIDTLKLAIVSTRRSNDFRKNSNDRPETNGEDDKNDNEGFNGDETMVKNGEDCKTP